MGGKKCCCKWRRKNKTIQQTDAPIRQMAKSGVAKSTVRIFLKRRNKLVSSTTSKGREDNGGWLKGWLQNSFLGEEKAFTTSGQVEKNSLGAESLHMNHILMSSFQIQSRAEITKTVSLYKHLLTSLQWMNEWKKVNRFTLHYMFVYYFIW